MTMSMTTKTKAILVAAMTMAAMGCTGEAPAGEDAGAVDCGTPISCVAPAHGSVILVDEPDGTKSCLWGMCDPGWADCDGNPENGCEAPLWGAEWCGDCFTHCDQGQVCHAAGLENAGHVCQ